MTEAKQRVVGNTAADVDHRPVDHEKYVADLQAVLEVSRELSATDDLLHLVRAVEGAARKVLECERATLLLYDRDGQSLSRPPTDGTSSDGTSSEGTRASSRPFQEVIAREAARTGQRIEIDDPAADPRFDASATVGDAQPHNIVFFPLFDYDHNVVGVLQVENLAPLDPWDNELITVFDAQIGVAVQRQLLLEHYAEKQRLQRDLKLARDIQQGMLPKGNPSMPGFDIAGWTDPCDETGGDFWDHHTLPDGTLAVALADATGHGISAALMMAMARTLFRATTSISQDLIEIIDRVNGLLYDDFPDNRSVTAVFGFLQGDILRFLSAGHGPILRYVAAEDRFVQQTAHGVPLGMLARYPWPPAEDFTMATGDLMVLLTDGFFEWENEAEEQFGMGRIEDALRENLDRTAEEMIQAMRDAVIHFVDGVPQSDDLTALVIRKL